MFQAILAMALPHLTPDELELTSRQLKALQYQPGDVVFHQGDAADCFYIIDDGEVEIVLQQDDGSQLVLALRKAGEFFGEIGLLTAGKRTATVRAKTATRLLALNKQDFLAALDVSEQTRSEISQVAQRRLANIDKPPR